MLTQQLPFTQNYIEEHKLCALCNIRERCAIDIKERCAKKQSLRYSECNLNPFVSSSALNSCSKIKKIKIN